MWGCRVREAVSDLLEQCEEGWMARMPPNYVLNVVVYEVCVPDATGKTPDGRHHMPASSTLLHHIIAVAHARQRGEQVPDAVIVVPDQWLEPWVTPWAMRPRHFVNMVAEMLAEKANASRSSAAPLADARAPLGRWVFVFDGPPEVEKSSKVCERYSNLLSTLCPVPHRMDYVMPQALAFTTDLLQDVPIVEWETVATHRDDVERAWRPDFGLLTALLARQANESEVAVVRFPKYRESAQGPAAGPAAPP